jgi:predicted Zn-dependent protease
VLRRLLQTAAVSLAATVLWGDTAGLAANVPVLLSALSYSRDMEREADDFALAFLRANGMAPAPLIGLFQELEKLEGKDRRTGFLSTHPALGERSRRLPAE